MMGAWLEGQACPAPRWRCNRACSSAGVRLPALPRCRRRKAQIRPLPQFQKGGHGRQAMAAPAGGAAEGSPDGAAAAAAAGAGGEAAPSQQGQQHGQQQEAEEPHAEDVVHGMSRLSMAAETSRVPNVVSFGRGRGRGLAGVSRGRGGQKLHSHFMED